ncbi:MAG: histidine--tRNA ligase [Candidatus Izemoplasma sp.]
MYQKVKGTYDLLPADTAKWQAVERTIKSVSKIYNYKEIRTPIFEKTDLFHRGVGSDTDIVSKETYDFLDRAGRSNTLRPEGTAGVVRSYIENKIYVNPLKVSKLFYIGPMFRYERPQKGRYRQFSQFGAELFGSYSPLADAEIISYAVNVLKALKIEDVTVHLNSIGDSESKETYKKVLKDYLANDIESLCSDCQRRFVKNPLRILDCKVDSKSELLMNAPAPIEHLNEESKKHFDQVIEYLDAMKIEYIIDNSLVRGLDYYTHTVFEVKTGLKTLGSQNTLCGGGRYNNLVKELGGPDIPAVGFAFGFERLMLALEAIDFKGDKDYLHLYLMVLGEKPKKDAVAMLNKCRLGGLLADIDFLDKGMKQQFKQADLHQARFIAIYGENEMANETINIKDKVKNTEVTISKHELYNHIITELMAQDDNCSTCGDETDCETCEPGGNE